MRNRHPSFLIVVLLSWAAVFAPAANAQQGATPAPAFTLAPLPYPPNALEPVISESIMALHHGKHHQAYVDALNRAVAQDGSLAGLTLEQLVASASTRPAVVRNNAGGHWNHAFFWESMARPDQGGAPSSALAAALVRDFGSIEGFRKAFRDAGTGRFGSGWAWLIVGGDGKLKVTSTPNQDNPLMDLAEVRGTPLLGNDVWEHAYYLQYQNRRADYLDAWWRVVDWGVVSKRFERAVPAAR
jgi:Fe-Mn family superoxide dismutase